MAPEPVFIIGANIAIPFCSTTQAQSNTSVSKPEVELNPRSAVISSTRPKMHNPPHFVLLGRASVGVW